MSSPTNAGGPVQLEARRAIRECADTLATATREDVLDYAVSETDAGRDTARQELDRLEREGFVYLVPGEDGTEVRLP